MRSWIRRAVLWWRRARVAPYLESLAGILLVGGFFVYFYGISSLTFPVFHPFLPVVLLVAGRYGFVPGLLSALEATGGYYLMLLWQDHFDTMAPGEFSFLWPSAFLFSGMVMGELRDAEGRKYAALYEKFLKAKDAADTAELELDILTRAKRELEQRIFLDPNAISDMFDVFRSLERDEIDSIPSSVLSLATSFLGADSSGLYIRQKGSFVLEAETGVLPSPRRVPGGYLPFSRAYEKGEILSLSSHGVLPELPASEEGPAMSPLGVYPIRSGEEETRFLLVLWHAPFEKLTPEFFQTASMIADRASSRLMNLKVQRQTRESVSQDETTGFLRPVFFARRAAEELGKAYRYLVPLSLIEIRFAAPEGGFLDRHAALMTMRTIAKKLLREVDLVGVPPDFSTVWFCLPHTGESGASIVLSKLWDYWKGETASSQVLSGAGILFRRIVFEPGDRAKNSNVFAAMMKRLDGLYEFDPSSHVYSGKGFASLVRARLSEKGIVTGLFRLSFSAPSLDEVLFLRKDLGMRKTHAGRFSLPREAEVGVPLSGACLWIFLPQATEETLDEIERAAERAWAESDIPKLKRGGVSFERLLLGRSASPTSDLLVSLEEMGQEEDAVSFRPIEGALTPPSEVPASERETVSFPEEAGHGSLEGGPEEFSPEIPSHPLGNRLPPASEGRESLDGKGSLPIHGGGRFEPPVRIGSPHPRAEESPEGESRSSGRFPEELMMKVEDLIRDHGAQGLTRREIAKNSRGFARLDPESQEALLAELVASGRIVREQPEGRGRPRVSYVHVPGRGALHEE
uniref:GAF domain-containing protein n=1 Tax=Leptospirillum ferrodiazotrophum TaxID=412449 RepID=C6HU08_9BACT|nr:MAG: protein of unknown function [Leptospirillum ferrodiazotrophum]